MAEIASAFVSILPSARGFGRNLENEVGGETAAAGERIGADFGKAFALAGGALIAAGLTATIASALDQGAIADKYAASLGQTPGQAAKFGKLAGDLYAQAYGESFEDVAAGIAAVQGSFQKIGGKELEKVSKRALDFAAIFDIELPRAVSVASTVVKSGLAKNATEALDLMTSSAQKVPVALRENILDAADEYGQFFGAIGFDGPQAFSALVDNAKLGEFGIDKAGDAIKEFTILSTDMSTNSVAAYDTLGLSADKMAGDILAGGDKAKGATKKIVDGLLNIKDPVKQANTAISLFGTPLEDLGVKNIPTFLESLSKGEKGLGKFKGSTKAAGDTLADNAATKIEAFKRSMTQTFVEVIGGKVIPFIENTLIPRAQDLATAFSEKVQPAIEDVAGFFGDLFDKLSPVGDWLRENPDLVKAFGIGLGVVAAAMGAVTLATTLFSIALNSTGIPLIIIAIAALVAGLILAYQRSSQFREIVNQVGGGLREFAGFVRAEVVPVVADLIRTIGQQARPILAQLAKTFRNDIAPALATVVAKFREAQPTIQKVIGFVARLVVGYLKMSATVLGKVIPALTRFVGFIFSRVAPAIGQFISDIARGVTAVFNFGKKAIAAGQDVAKFAREVAKKIGDVIRTVMDIPDRIKSALGDLGTLLYNAGRDLIQGLIDGIMSKLNDIGDALGSVGQKIKDHMPGSPVKEGPLRDWNDGKGGVSAAGKKLGDGIADGIASRVSTVSKAMKKVTGAIKAEFDQLKSASKDLSSSVADAFRPDMLSGNLADFFSVGQQGAGNLKAVIAAFAKLKKFGLSASFLSDLYASGNTGLILDLASSDKATARNAQSLFNQNAALSNQLGRKVAGNEFAGQFDTLANRIENAIDRLGNRADRQTLKGARALAAAINGAAVKGRRDAKV